MGNTLATSSINNFSAGKYIIKQWKIFRGCVPEMFVASCSVTYRIYVPGKPGICFHYYCAVYDDCKYSDTFWQIVLVFLWSTSSHYHPCANLYEGIEVIKCLSDIFCRVCKIKHILCVIQYTICGLYVFSLPIYLVMIERIYMLCLIIIIESEVWTITHCLGLGHEKMVSTVYLSIFSWPVQARITKLRPQAQKKNRSRSLLFWRVVDLNLQGQIYLQSQIHIYVYLDHFTVTTVSQSQTSAHILIQAARYIWGVKVAMVVSMMRLNT